MPTLPTDHTADLQATSAHLADDVLTLATGACTARFAWLGGRLAALSLAGSTAPGSETEAGPAWTFAKGCALVTVPGIPDHSAAEDGVLIDRQFPGDAVQPAHRRVVVRCRLGELELRRTFRLYPRCPAIAMDLELRGRADGPWRDAGAAAGDLVNLERLAEMNRGTVTPTSSLTLNLPDGHHRVLAVRFRDITDRRNNLVEPVSMLPYRAAASLAGNVLLLSDCLADRGFFVLKEAPCSDVQLASPGYDFQISRQFLRTVGVGLNPADLDPEAWHRAYGVVFGVGGAAETDLLEALRDYQGRRRRHLPGRDSMVLLNTWGDRGQDSRLGEAFAMKELDLAHQLGVSHFQLDDGWQNGRTSNSAFKGGSLANIWDQPDYWTPHSERFPQGLGPLQARARELGIELCLWFNPSADDSYAHWQEDADTLIRLHREHGIRTFKIDGVKIPDALADRNLRAMFDRVVAATEGDAVFNLDVTAGRRWGYHLGCEYGNLFVENRYTDWSNHYPHWTLRNLWQLARYAPPQSLQMEFLNVWRNPDKYPDNDPLAPRHVPFAYAFALTMVAQPLAWFEAQNLPPEAFATGALIRGYRAIQDALHACRIFPVGDEPDGTGWTGFQALEGDGRQGFLLVLREFNERPTARLRLHDARLRGRTLRLEPLLDGKGPVDATAGGTTEVDVDDYDAIPLALPAPFSFRLYRYSTLA